MGVNSSSHPNGLQGPHFPSVSNSIVFSFSFAEVFNYFLSHWAGRMGWYLTHWGLAGEDGAAGVSPEEAAELL